MTVRQTASRFRHPYIGFPIGGDVKVQISESGANTPTDRVSRTILGVANDIRSDGTRTFAQEITRLISESRDA